MLKDGSCAAFTSCSRDLWPIRKASATWNIPAKIPSDRSVQVFKEIIARGWNGREVRFHNRIGKDGNLELTSIFPFLSRTIDLAASNFATGSLDTLGITPPPVIASRNQISLIHLIK